MSNGLALVMFKCALIHASCDYNFMVELLLLCVQLFDMHVDLSWLCIVGLVMYMLWLKEYVLLIGMVLLNVHKGFQSKLHSLLKCPFLAWFDIICEYGLILSTSFVLTSFIPFPKHFKFWSVKMLLQTTFEEDLEFWIIQDGTSSHSEGNTTIKLMMLL